MAFIYFHSSLYNGYVDPPLRLVPFERDQCFIISVHQINRDLFNLLCGLVAWKDNIMFHCWLTLGGNFIGCIYITALCIRLLIRTSVRNSLQQGNGNSRLPLFAFHVRRTTIIETNPSTPVWSVDNIIIVQRVSIYFLLLSSLIVEYGLPIHWDLASLSCGHMSRLLNLSQQSKSRNIFPSDPRYVIHQSTVPYSH